MRCALNQGDEPLRSVVNHGFAGYSGLIGAISIENILYFSDELQAWLHEWDKEKQCGSQTTAKS